MVIATKVGSEMRPGITAPIASAANPEQISALLEAPELKLDDMRQAPDLNGPCRNLNLFDLAVDLALE